MPLPPRTTPVPKPVFVPGMSPVLTDSSSPVSPTPSSLPDSDHIPTRRKDAASDKEGSSSKEDFSLPKLRLEIRDLNHPGAKCFLDAVNVSDCLAKCVRDVLRLLYVTPSDPFTTAPTTRSVTLILRDMEGVAYTTGTDLDNDHKEIHFSLGYIASIPKTRCTDEVSGVITHELVHCYQYNGRGTCPGGLIEGIADWVRLNCELCPPHWKREADGEWDGGYQKTAYFLEYLEQRFGAGTVRRLNEKLRTQKYGEKEFWTGLLGRPVEQLWEDYRDKLKDDEAVFVNKEDISS